MIEIKDKNYVEFTKEMKDEYTILAPTMLPIHFNMFSRMMAIQGYKLEFYEGDVSSALNEGLRSVHNDMCFPALIVVGQMLHALKSGEYDPNKTALVLSQTGGGCRASNYIPMLRRALKENGFEQVPVISVNQGGETHSGLVLTPDFLLQVAYAILYADFIMYISNQCRPYEINKGDTEKAIEEATELVLDSLENKKYLKTKVLYTELIEIFNNIEKSDEKKPRVGIMGEIFMKYSPIGNNHLEEFLLSEGCEVVVPGIMDFCLYCLNDAKMNKTLYGISDMSAGVKLMMTNLIEGMQKTMISVIKSKSNFTAPASFKHLKELVNGYISEGMVMGEGWLVTAEMLEFIDIGVNNIVCAQPFGCLPNHIVGKGMNRKILSNHPEANIVTIDYDPSSSKVNQENRIKLMLGRAKMAELF